MAIKTINEIMNSMNRLFADATDSDTLDFMEDVGDTLNDFDSRVNKATQEKDDIAKRYKERFSGKREKQDDTPPEDNEEVYDGSRTRYTDLFIRKEG